MTPAKLSPLLIKFAKAFCIFLLFIVFFFALSPTAHSQNFPKSPIDCDSQKKDDNYHSLRPLPFSPCDAGVSGAIQCGNTVYVADTITKRVCLKCQTGSGPCTCSYHESPSGNVTIDFSNSELPIVGNTEDVANWDVSTDTLSDVEKVNQYVSWYLNGVINRAEYSYLDMSKNCIGETTQRAGVCLSTDPILGLCLSPNPVSPILPPIPNLLLQTDGINSCGEGKKSCCVTINPLVRKVDILDRDKLINFSGPIRKLLPQRIQDDSREEQVNEVLTKRHNQIVACTYGVNINIPFLNWQIGAIPGPCKDLGFFGGLVGQRKRRILEWQDHLPPKREEFPEFKDYYKEYRRWRGDRCLSFEIPLTSIELMLCFDNPLKPNFYGDLYPYIPFTSTEDRVGVAEKEVPASINVGGTNNLKLSDIRYDAADLKLYYAHMQEAVELSDLLKKSYVPKEGTGGEGETTPVEVRDGCQILNIRTNDGDHLVDPGWNENKKTITGNLKYTADFDCTFQAPTTSSACTVNPVIPISLNTQNPLHDELWHNLVSGVDSIFRRIFPKTGNEAPVIAPKDIPGMTKFESSSNRYTIVTGGEIYFPHLGGISEYFLKAIQTALRPKGYGEPFDRGRDADDEETKCKVDVPDSAVPGKYLGSFKSNFIGLADRWSAKCPGPENNLAEECYNYVASEADKANVNPAFALTIWLNESGASNYCEGGSTTQDFGINIAGIYQNIVEQLKVFLGMAGTKLCSGVAGFTEPMHGWLSRFQSSAGVCNPADTVATQYYIDVRDNTWSWVTGCSSGGKFGITWPTDYSCP